jgi:hypothetical protein
MYNELSISTLVERLGFGVNNTPVEIDPLILTGTSGRTISYFHKLATLEILYSAVPLESLSEEGFTKAIIQLKTNAVKSMLIEILDTDTSYKNEIDYSSLLIARPKLFENAIGYSLAISIIEYVLTSRRINYKQRDAQDTFKILKIDLEGIKDKKSSVKSISLRDHQNKAIQDAKAVIFKKNYAITAPNLW